MKRIFVGLALLAVATLVISGCGGGGGGGSTSNGGGNPPGGSTLSGRVLSPDGTPVANAQVTVDTGSSRAILSDTTDSNGLYTVGGVPLGVAITITVTAAGLNNTVLNGVSFRTDAGTSLGMDIVAGSETPGAGSTASISPTPSDITEGETRTFDIVVKNGAGIPISPASASGWRAVVVVTGSATGRIIEGSPNSFTVTGGAAGGQARISVLVVLADGTLASSSALVNITSVMLPPPPPI